MKHHKRLSKDLMQHRVAKLLNEEDDMDEVLKDVILEICHSLDELLLTHCEAAMELDDILNHIVMKESDPFVLVRSASDIVCHVLYGMKICTNNLATAADSATKWIKASWRTLR